MYFIFLFTFLFGAIIGSFLNVVIYRMNTGKTLGGRSQCFSCGHVLKPAELIPIFSFLFQKGKCKNCRSAISFQYPLVEIATGTLFALGIWKLFPIFSSDPAQFLTLFLFYCIVVSILVVIFVYDIRHKIIPDGLSLAFGVVSLMYLSVVHEGSLFGTLQGLSDVLIGPAIALVFFLLWLFSKGTWIGLGDAKLVVGIGFMLGFVYSISAVIVAFWIGAVYSLVLLSISKMQEKRKKYMNRVTMRTEIPFAPFLITGLLLVFFFEWDVLYLHEIFSLFN